MRMVLFQQGLQLSDHLVGDDQRNFLDEDGTAVLQIEDTRLVAQYDALGIGAAADRGNGRRTTTYRQKRLSWRSFCCLPRATCSRYPVAGRVGGVISQMG
jgi:hypothetical protein